MRKINSVLSCIILAAAVSFFPFSSNAQVVISQYYEGTGTNKWIELTNLGNSAVNLASPQLKLGLWSVTGSTGNITFTGAPSNTYNLTVTIPAKGSVLIGNTGNGTEVPYLTAASANETSNAVINFNGNDGVALLDASNNIIDKFGEGINAADISYVRSTSITGPNATYTASEWANTSLVTVQGAGSAVPARLGYQLAPLCAAPAAQPTALSFSGVTSSSINGSFTASTADGFVVVQSTSSSLSSNPADGTTYPAGNSLGGGTVISSGTSTSFSSSALNSNTTYYFFVFAYNNSNCSGGPKYLTASPLSGSQATPYPPCAAPSSQPTALSFSGVTSSSINGSFTASTANGYLVVRSTGSSLSANPADATTYSAGNSLGGGTVVSSGSSASFSATGLSSNTVYYFFVFAYNNTNCTGGPKYLTASPLSGNQTTLYPPCITPANSATSIVFSSVTSTSMTTSFTAASGADGYLVVRSTGSSLSSNPVDGTTYVAGNTVGGGTVISAGASTSVAQTGLTAATAYYFFVFSYNNVNCSAGPAYKTTAPLTGNRTTDPAVLSYYYGNLHSHSSYSDGNADNNSKTPADDYAFAKTALCMDFLGISEHNHAGAGMNLANWAPGKAQAVAATTGNFIAMHGQEWGVIGIQGAAGDNAGHVVVYGLDSLAGWETNNYQIFVPKSVYTGTGGLFDIINRHGNNAFASLAHPDNYDFDNLLNTAYDVKADDAIAATAVKSGAAFSTDTTYSSPAGLDYFAFYKNMLAKGYHLGPTVDHDNHNMTFGKTAKTRLAIMATSLSEANILDAMRKMRFYATDDCAAKVNFTINTLPMGSIMTKAGAPVIAVTTITTNAVTSIKLMYGVPGSGSSPTTLTSVVNSSSLNYTHTALANLATGYYFLDITESGGARIITSPIWYTRDNSAQRPMFITSFFTVNENDKVILKWTASNEPAGEQYEIQRSFNTIDFITIGSVAGKAYGLNNVNYAVEDNSPVNGVAYYRLVRKGADGKISYSELKVIDRSVIASPWFVAYPNPVKDQLWVKIVSTQNEKSNVEVFDIAGRKVKTLPVALTKGEQNVQLNTVGLTKGTYVIRMYISGKPFTQMLNKL